MLATGKQQRVDHALVGDRRSAEARQLGIDEAHVEAGIMGDQIALFEEGDKLLGNLGKARLVPEEGVVEAMDARRVGRHRPLGVEIGVEAAAGRDVVDELDGADLDDTIAGKRFEPGGFCVEDDFAHDLPASVAARACRCKGLLLGRPGARAQQGDDFVDRLLVQVFRLVDVDMDESGRVTFSMVPAK